MEEKNSAAVKIKVCHKAQALLEQQRAEFNQLPEEERGKYDC